MSLRSTLGYVLLRLQRDNYLKPSTFEPLDNGIINNQFTFIVQIIFIIWVLPVRIVSVSELKENTFVIPLAHLVMDGFLALRHTDNRFLLRRLQRALSLRQVLRDKSGGQSHFLGFFHKELHQSLALVLYPIVEYGILECFLQIADLA